MRNRSSTIIASSTCYSDVVERHYCRTPLIVFLSFSSRTDVVPDASITLRFDNYDSDLYGTRTRTHSEGSETAGANRGPHPGILPAAFRLQPASAVPRLQNRRGFV